MTDYEAIITARDIQMRDNPSWIEIRKLVQKHESKIEDLEKEIAEAKDIIEDLITKIPASLVEHFESEKERAEKFLGWK